jgi:hypothetical protein
MADPRIRAEGLQWLSLVPNDVPFRENWDDIATHQLWHQIQISQPDLKSSQHTAPENGEVFLSFFRRSPTNVSV